jgi:hypothetical protein
LESTSAAPSSTVAPEPKANLADALRKCAQEEADGDILLTLNNILQALEPVPRSSHNSPLQTSSASVESSVPVVSDPITSPDATTSEISHNGSFDALDRISSALANLTSSFTLPTIDFSSPSETSSRPSSPTTHVPYTATNQPVHAYEAALGKLLIELDAVESDGDDTIRVRRRELVKSIEAALTELDQAVEAQRQRWHSQSGVPASDTDVPVDAEGMVTCLNEYEELGSGSVVAASHNPETLRYGDNAAGVDSSSKANTDVDEADMDNVHVVDAQNLLPTPDYIASEEAVKPEVPSVSLTADSSHLLQEDDKKTSLHHSTTMDCSLNNNLDTATPPSPDDRHEAESSASPAASDASEVDLEADSPLDSDSASISDISSGSASDLEDFVNVDGLPERDVVLATPADDGVSDQEDGWSDLEEAMPE